jgi:hypothetical protein
MTTGIQRQRQRVKREREPSLSVIENQRAFFQASLYTPKDSTVFELHPLEW